MVQIWYAEAVLEPAESSDTKGAIYAGTFNNRVHLALSYQIIHDFFFPPIWKTHKGHRGIEWNALAPDIPANISGAETRITVQFIFFSEA